MTQTNEQIKKDVERPETKPQGRAERRRHHREMSKKIKEERRRRLQTPAISEDLLVKAGLFYDLHQRSSIWSIPKKAIWCICGESLPIKKNKRTSFKTLTCDICGAKAKAKSSPKLIQNYLKDVEPIIQEDFDDNCFKMLAFAKQTNDILDFKDIPVLNKQGESAIDAQVNRFMCFVSEGYFKPVEGETNVFSITEGGEEFYNEKYDEFAQCISEVN